MVDDFRAAVRLMRRFPALMVVAMVSIAIVVAAVTVFASIANGLLFWQPRVQNADQLFIIQGGHSLNGRISYVDFQDYREATRDVASVAALAFDGTSVTLGGQTEVVADGVVSGNYFSLLGVSAALGRVFAEGQADIGDAVVLSDRLWRRFGGSPEIIGKTVLVYGTAYTVVGVLPQEFLGFSPDLPIDLWLPAEAAQRSSLGPLLRNRNTRLFRAVVRTAGGVVTPGVLESFRRVDLRLDQEFGRPRVQTGPLTLVNPRGILEPRRRQSIIDALQLLGIVLGLILLIVCSNVASLMLTIMRQRRQEIAVRSALGARAARLLRQLATEGIVIWGTAGLAGLLLAMLAMRVAIRSFPPRLFGTPLALGVELNLTTLLLSVGSCVIVGLVFSCLPALAGLKRSALRGVGSTTVAGDGTARSWAPGMALVAGQVALSTALVVANAQIIRSLYNASQTDLGYESIGRVAYYLHPNPAGFAEEATPAFYEHLLENVRASPGVRSAALVDFLPLSGMASRTCYGSAEAPAPPAASAEQVSLVVVSPGYFDTLGIRLLGGRDFAATDRREAEAAVVVNQAFATSQWPGQNPVGQRLRIGQQCSVTAQVVGVVENAAQTAIDAKGEPVIYAPFNQQTSVWPWRTVIADIDEAPTLALERVRREILRVSPGASVQRGQTVEEEVAVRLWPMRATAAMMGVLGLVGILVAASGVYALVSTFVASRIREIGLRLALGATASTIGWLVVARCFVPSSIGLVLGVYLANRGTRLAVPVLYGVNPTDAAAYSGALVLLGAAIAIAVWLPTRRAVRTDPSAALRMT